MRWPGPRKGPKGLAELDMAHTTLERVLNFPHPPETLPWGDAMSKSYLFHIPCLLGIDCMYAICQSVVCCYPIIRFHCYRLKDATTSSGNEPVSKGKAKPGSSSGRSTTASPPSSSPSDAPSPGIIRTSRCHPVRVLWCDMHICLKLVDVCFANMCGPWHIYYITYIYYTIYI